MRTRRMSKALQLVYVVSVIAFAGTLGCSERKAQTGSETHFLRTCTASCDDGLECVNALCTRTCAEAAECQVLHQAATCVAEGATSTCQVVCGSDASCQAIGDGLRCSGDVCRSSSAVVAPPSDGGSAGLASIGSAGGVMNGGAGASTGGASAGAGGASGGSSGGMGNSGPTGCRVLGEAFPNMEVKTVNVEALATVQDSFSAAVDETGLYWVTLQGALFVHRWADNMTVQLSEDANTSNNLGVPQKPVMNADMVFFSSLSSGEEGVVGRTFAVPKAGGTVEVLFEGASESISLLGTVGDRVVGARGGAPAQQVYEVSRNPPSASLLDFPEGISFRLRGERLYWQDPVAAETGESVIMTTLFSDGVPVEVPFTGTGEAYPLAFAENHMVWQVSPGSSGSTLFLQVQEIEGTLGEPLEICGGSVLALDDEYLYFLSWDNREPQSAAAAFLPLLRVNIETNEVVELVGANGRINVADFLTMDDRALYFWNRDGEIVVVEKP